MQSPLDASANTVAELFSKSTFVIPQYQREYSWRADEVEDFWTDLQNTLDLDNYFLGLIILTDDNGEKHVVDGQQRIVTLTLLANAIYHEAIARNRKALADRIWADFLRSIDYETDDINPRVVLADQTDNDTFQQIIETGEVPENIKDTESVSYLIANSYKVLKEFLASDLKSDPFKRLGKWTEFLTNRVYFAVFVHPDAATAYKVFEIINTRGRGLTTADLLKNYVLGQTPKMQRDEIYKRWRDMAKSFTVEGSSNVFVQFIRHAVTVGSGHILPQELFGFLAQRQRYSRKSPPVPLALVDTLEGFHSLYLQMIDPTISGPAEGYALRVFEALNEIGVIAVRPILLALNGQQENEKGCDYILRLVVRRIVVGSLGTGNIERRFSEAARDVHETGNWTVLQDSLDDLNPSRDDFVNRLSSRTINKATLTFLRRSILQGSVTPEPQGTLHLIWPRNTDSWDGMDVETDLKWVSTVGNPILSDLHKRPKEASIDFQNFKYSLLENGVDNEWAEQINQRDDWTAVEIQKLGEELAESAGDLWYGG